MKPCNILKLAALLLSLAILHSQLSTCFAQGTAFTYQGRLDSSGEPYTGSAEFQPTLWDSASGGTQVAANSPASVVVGVTNGLFVLPLDFSGAFPGADRWLQLEVRTTIGAFTTLAPRQKITATPYAFTAGSLTGNLPAAQLSGTIPSTSLGGTYSGAVTFNNAANNFTGNGAGLTGLDASQMASGTVPDARLASNVARTNQVWILGGNSGTTAGTDFIGTADNEPLELRVNNQRALRLEPNTNGPPNVIGGSAINGVGPNVVGATISGGGGSIYSNKVDASFGTVSGGFGNTIQTNALRSTIGGGSFNSIHNAFDATIGGGLENTIKVFADYSTIGGGLENTIEVSAYRSTIGGGRLNKIGTNTYQSTIGGGRSNRILTNAYNSTIAGGIANEIQDNASSSTVGGGSSNTILNNGHYATIPGGSLNAATNFAFAAGNRAKANHTGAFVWADSQNADFASTTPNQFNIRASGGARFETSGAGVLIDGQPVLAGTIGTAQISDGSIVNADISPTAAITDSKLATIASAGKVANSATTATSANTANAIVTRDASGNFTAGAITATSLSGSGSAITSLNASQLTSGTVPDARLAANVARTNQVWGINGNSGTIAGTHFVGTTDNQTFELKVNNQRALRLEPNASGAPNVIGGSAINVVGPGVVGATIGGGGATNFDGGVYINRVNANLGTVSGGGGNVIQSDASAATIAGGNANVVQNSAVAASIMGGFANSIQTNANFASIGGGHNNTIRTNAPFATIGGGQLNLILNNGNYATIPGGYFNVATNYAFAAGHRAKANHTGSFVWGDTSNADIASFAANSVTMRASGGYRLFSNSGATAGVSLAAGGTSWGVISDANVKKNFAAVDGKEVLEKLASIPVQQWNYQWEDEDSIPHIGPMAQEFKAAFYPGRDDKSITTQEVDGVALAAIQGLNEKLEEEVKHSRAKDARIASLEKRLAELEQALHLLVQGK